MAISLSHVNSQRIYASMQRLALHVQLGYSNPNDASEFDKLCLSLSRGIDYAIANGEIPAITKQLAMLMKQISQRNNQRNSTRESQAAFMVLMISVKNACKLGWFQMKDSEELLTIAVELGKIYCTPESVSPWPTSPCHSAIPIIMDRFYPNMKLGSILVSVEAKAGYGCSAVDFHITKSNNQPAKIWLLVAQTDNIETSACLINPQQVNFLLNGDGIDARTNVQMDPGPQMPTDVTSMLKYGTNLLQVVGQFNGHYIIVVAHMYVTSLPEHRLIPNYVQPLVTSVDSDIIEGSSRISLNCPISFKRIKTPVKGHSCKHYQCFDFYNFVNINFKKPSWRCPHCNQYVCYTEIRLDQKMTKILENVGKDIVEVMINADGSWKAVSESDHDVEKEQTEPRESTLSPNIVPDVLDLANEDNLDIMDSKPCQDSVQGQLVSSNSSSSLLNFTGIDQNVGVQLEDRTDVYTSVDRFETQIVGVPVHPVLPVTVYPASNQEAEGHNNNLTMNYAMQNLISEPNNVQLQSNYINSVVNEYGRSSSAPRHINRIPIAVQALPVQSQALPAVPNRIPRQNSVTNLSSLQTSSSSVAPHVSLSNPASAAIRSDIERQHRIPRQNSVTNLTSLQTSSSSVAPNVSLSNPAPAGGILSNIGRRQSFTPNLSHQVSGLNSSTQVLLHQSETQNRMPPVNMSAPSQLQNPCIAASWLNQFSNPQMQQTLNPQQYQPMPSTNTQWSHIQQGGPQAMNIASSLASRHSQSNPFQNLTSPDIFQLLTADQRRPVQSVSRPDELFNSPPDPNWRPTARMRGSLAGRHVSDDIRQRIIAPSQLAQSMSSRPQFSSQLSSQADILASFRNAQYSSRP